MKHGYLKLATLLIVGLSLIMLTAGGVSANSRQVVDAKAALIADATTGQVIYQQNANRKLPVASVSKLLTACVIEDEIQHNQLSWNDKITVTKQVAAISNDKTYSTVGLQQGEAYTVRDLYDAMLIKSADGAALALATAHGQTMAQFNHKMRAKAKQIGLTDYTIVNPVGLDNEDMKGFALKQYHQKAQNSMTARDVALLAQHLLENYPNTVQTTGKTKAQITIKGQSHSYQNLNKMLVGQSMAMSDITVDGLKTGTSQEAGACFASSGQYRGHRIITVVLNAKGGGDARFTATQQLYRYLQSHYRLQSLQLKAADRQVLVYNGQHRVTKVTPAVIQVWTNKKINDATITTHYRASIAKWQGVKAPLHKGQRIGTARVHSPVLKSLNYRSLSVPLYAAHDNPVGNFWQRLGYY